MSTAGAAGSGQRVSTVPGRRPPLPRRLRQSHSGMAPDLFQLQAGLCHASYTILCKIYNTVL